MKKILFAALFWNLILAAGDFSWQLIGRPSAKYSRNIATALFDNEVHYSKDCVLWDSSAAFNGCGLIIRFNKTVQISKVELVSCKPNNNPYIPERTEFYSWNGDKLLWNEPVTVADVTGRATDTKFVAPSVITTWELPGGVTTDALKILMYARGIWLTEVRIYDMDGKRLNADNVAAPAVAAARSLSPAAVGGGASANINYFNQRQNYIGNPNGGNRKDRVLLRFDISSFLAKNQVRHAELSLALEPMGDMSVCLLAVEAFTVERTTLAAMDLISGEVKPVALVLIDRKSSRDHRVDVTAVVNEMLAAGNGSVAFRIRNLTVERNGNQRNKAEGVYIRYQHTKLGIWE